MRQCPFNPSRSFTFQLLAATEALGGEILASLEKAARYYHAFGHGSFAPGNAEGGLTTIEEKSLGAYCKSGAAEISGLIKPGDRPPQGGLYLLDVVPDRPLDTLLSGLVAGVIAGQFFGKSAGEDNLITFDMGGTSCDVGLIVDGSPKYTTQFDVEWGLPISNPATTMAIGPERCSTSASAKPPVTSARVIRIST